MSLVVREHTSWRLCSFQHTHTCTVAPAPHTYLPTRPPKIYIPCQKLLPSTLRNATSTVKALKHYYNGILLPLQYTETKKQNTSTPALQLSVYTICSTLTPFTFYVQLHQYQVPPPTPPLL
uniref:Uncharacterized protein n=1 Tax=Bactrocera latifrons TaxID=174628 RepID=A0A0K8UE88_BACLA